MSAIVSEVWNNGNILVLNLVNVNVNVFLPPTQNKRKSDMKI
jgi:hypothetical protein